MTAPALRALIQRKCAGNPYLIEVKAPADERIDS
jgi:hypothetical protein